MEKNPMLEPEYIDRKKLLGKQKTIDGEPYVRLWDLLMAPVEDVAPVVHGRWDKGTKTMRSGSVFVGHICSCCGQFNVSASNYCPNCGCRMDGGNE